MNNLSAGLQEYYRAVEREIPCSGKDKKRYLNDILESLYNLQSEQPSAGYDTASDRIGDPETLGETYKETMSAASIRKKVIHGNNLKAMIAAIIGVIAICAIVFVITFIHDVRERDNMRHGFIITYPAQYLDEPWEDVIAREGGRIINDFDEE